jgi:tripartite-type tricarboxylate transporter receptor subunit TctC
MRRTLLSSILVAWATLTFVVPLHAQSYPTQPVKVMVQQGAGGSIDVIARILAEHLSPALGQPVVVLNQPGAGGLVASRALVGSPPDGYTLFLAASSVFVSLPEIQSNLNFSVNDFVPIGFVGEQPFVIAVSDTLGVNTIPDLIALSKKRPEGINFAAGTRGGLQHMTAEWFRKRSGANLTMVHYPSTPAALGDLVAGRVPAIVDSLSGLVGPATGGHIKMIGIAAPKAPPTYTQIPTISPTIPDFNASGWFVLVGPKGTPPAVVQKMGDSLRTALAQPALQKKFNDVGTFTRTMNPTELAAFMRKEQDMWRPIVREVAPPR